MNNTKSKFSKKPTKNFHVSATSPPPPNRIKSDLQILSKLHKKKTHQKKNKKNGHQGWN